MSIKTTYEVELVDGGSIKAKTADMQNFTAEAKRSAAATKAMKASYQSYDQGRATVGTGASGRDFAKESQGLGGLVRVYATFAANIFAVSAAFNALSSAADTKNLVQGLDQLGAASGRNLGTLSKRLVEATDNSVSLREAMTATAQASSAGMSSTEILKLAKGAKQASQALGIDMSDALSRLTRGISKIEPELLDELGIFVRVDKAAQDYAKSIGKSVGALTDFERRASFSTAVLQQLNDKFGALEIDANPYNQLLANLKNVSSAGLNLVNTVLGPIVRLLGESPTALSVVLGLIGATLVKQAIPALGAWRQELKKSAEATNEHVAETKKLYDQYRANTITADTSAQAVAFRAASAAVDKHADALTTLEGINKRTSLSRGITAFVAAPTDATAASVLAQGAARQKALEAEVIKGVTAARATAIDDELAGIAKLKPAVESLTASNKELNKTKSEYKGVSTGYWSLASMYERIDDAAKKSAKSIQIVTNAVENASLGPLLAISMATKEITAAYGAKQISGVGAFFTAIKAGSAIAMVSINTLLASMSGVLNVVGVLVGFTALLVTFFSENEREASRFASSIEDLKSSFDNVDRTINVISKKDPLAQMGIESTQARANAFIELSGKLDEASDAYTKLKDKNTGWVDSTIDSLKGIANMDIASDISKNMALSMSKAMILLDNPELKKELQDKFKVILGLDSLTTANVTEKLKSAIKTGDVDTVAAYNKAIADGARNAASAASDLTGYKDAVRNANTSMQEYLNTLNISTPLGKAGLSIINLGFALNKLTDSSVDSQKALIDLMNDTKTLSLFNNDFALGLVSIKDAYIDGASEVANYTQQLEAQKIKLAELIALRDAPPTFMEKLDQGAIALGSLGLPDKVSPSYRPRESSAVSVAMQQQRAIEVNLERANTEFAKVQVDSRKILIEGMQSAFQKGSELIAQSLGNASEKAAITAMSGATGLLTGSAAASAQDKIAAKSDAVQMRAIDVTLAQILSQTKLTNTIEVANSLTRQAMAKRDKGESSPEYQNATTAYNAAVKVQSALGSKSGVQQLYKQGLAKGASQEDILAASQLSPYVQAMAGSQAQKIELRGKGEAREVNAAGMAPIFQAQENTTPALLQQKARNTLELERLGILKSIVGAENEGMIKQRISLELSNAELEAGVSFVETNAKIVGLQAQLKTTAGAMLDPQLRAERSQTLTKQLREAELSILKQTSITSKGAVDLEAEKLAKLAKELAIVNALKDVENLRYTIALDVQDAQNAADFAAGKISENAKNNADLAMANARALEDADNKRAVQQDIITSASEKYASTMKNLKDTDIEAKTVAEDTLRATVGGAVVAKQKIDLELEGKQKILQLGKKLTTQEELFRTTTLTGLNNISDAFVDLAFTGKDSFADMVNAMLLDLARLEMRMALMKGLEGVGGTQGLFNGFMSFFNKAPTGANPMQLDPAQMASAAVVPSAMGTAWDAGIQKFAMGASFTNGIVNSPTMFKFAQGTGLMGEAGPEAIMPLKRDANGNLGVRAGQSGSEVNVVVNNYSNEPATTNETVDSRGQRRIEVTIGSMVAGEIARGGSSAQNSIRGTFGQQPQLLRR